ncbi:Hypothetical predicted protein [Cloeon dipterum]|uniref:Uncharacterized protein n=1 Tax=Cloeon dipterum TaxID=197152 RepID=A0A8S1DSV7_9INSE|nr:Hypothetical predicted protein [Cloeon dipterum]
MEEGTAGRTQGCASACETATRIQLVLDPAKLSQPKPEYILNNEIVFIENGGALTSCSSFGFIFVLLFPFLILVSENPTLLELIVAGTLVAITCSIIFILTYIFTTVVSLVAVYILMYLVVVFWCNKECKTMKITDWQKIGGILSSAET